MWPLKLDGLWLNTPATSAIVSLLALIILIRSSLIDALNMS
ncbi:hypothetical protein HNQ56_002292 [Anaerotaenia torta]